MLNCKAARYLVMCLAVNLVAWSLPTRAQAVLVAQNFTFVGSDVGFPVSADDLINQGEPTFLNQSSTGFTVSSGSDTDNFNNGTLGATVTNADLAWDADGAWTTTFNLDLTNAQLGYAIENIRTYAGWDSCCYGQYYSLEYSLVGDANFISLGSFTHDPNVSGKHTTYIDFTDTTGTIATGVDAIRFIFDDPGTSDNAMREIDIFGTALTVPEPSTFALLGLGVIGLEVKARRRRAAHSVSNA